MKFFPKHHSLIFALAVLGESMNGASSFAAGGDKSHVSVAIAKTEDKSVAQDQKSEDLVTILNISGGFSLGSGLIGGLKYFSYSQDSKVLDNVDLEISGFGPMIGYMHANGLYANFAYLYAPTKEFTADSSEVTYQGGDGYVIDFGKVWDLSSSLGIGLAMTQSKISYTEANIAAEKTNLKDEWSDTSLYPYLSIFVFF